jgi:ribokinase
MLKASLAKAGVGTSEVEEIHDSSGVASITTLTSGENQILLVPGANHAVSPAFLERHSDALIGAAMILTQLETPLETLECLTHIAEKNRIPLMLDPAPALSLPAEVMRHVTWLTPNQSEANLLLSDRGIGSALKAEGDVLEELMRSGPRNVLLKLGARGLLAGTEDGRLISVPAFPVQAIDTTAAGDALNGGLATALAQGLEVRRALILANAVAAISVTRQGAQPSMPTRREVDAFLAQHAKGSDIDR